jgi:dihydrolipoamide dehydrogenase
VSIDFNKIIARKDDIVNRLVSGVRYLLKKNRIRLVEGTATISPGKRIHIQKVDGTEDNIAAKNIIIATGSVPKVPLNIHVDRKNIITTDEALRLHRVPESIAILGGGKIGLEFAEIFNSLGVNVKILEETSNILPSFEDDLVKAFLRILKKKGIEIYTDVDVKSVNVEIEGKVRIIATSSNSQLDLNVEKVLLAVGRKPFTEDLGLENIGIILKDGFVVVDEKMRTNVPNIYAVGDVTGGKQFAHIAFAEGIVVAENIFGMETAIDYTTVPMYAYTSPEIASIGLSEKKATKLRYKVSIGRFPYMANGRALTLGEREGFVKIISDRETDELLGIHILGGNATDLIGEAAIAIKLECTSEELSATIHAHPTLSETLMEAALAVSKKAIHR